MLKPRETLNWDEYFMSMALLVGQKSKDPETQVGSVIVDSRNCVIGVGFNGAPQGIPDDKIPWDRTGKNELDKKYIWVSHAESNSLDFADKTRMWGARMYVTLFPCSECAKRIIQAKISEVVYLVDKYHDTESCVAARKMFDWAGIKYRKFKSDVTGVIVRF